MAVYSGRNKAIGIAQESTFDSWATPAAWFALKEEMAVINTVEILKTAHVRQKPYDVEGDSIAGLSAWTGKLTGTFPTQCKAMRILLANAFGGQTNSGSNPQYTHTYKALGEFMEGGLSLTALTGDGANLAKASGGRVKTLALTLDSAGQLIFDAELIGATYALDAIGAIEVEQPTLATVPWYLWKHLTVKLDNEALVVSGLNLTIDFGVAEDKALSAMVGSPTYSLLGPNGVFNVTGTLKRRWIVPEDSTTKRSIFEDYAIAQDGHTLELTFDTGGNEKMTIYMEAQFDMPTKGQTGIFTEEIPFHIIGMAGSTADSAFILTIQDGEAT